MLDKKIHIQAILYCVSVLCIVACSKHSGGLSDQYNEEQRTNYYVNQFAYNMISTYYLWVDDIQDGLSGWTLTEDPIAKVRSVRYKDAAGKDIDRWTMLTDDYESFQGRVSGNTKSMGFEFVLYYANDKKNVVAVVTYAYPSGPAVEAGLKRGDVIVEIDGKLMTPDNYVQILESSIYGDGTSTFTLADKRDVTLTARQMLLNPVNCHKVLQKDGKKYGYLHFTSFTADCCGDLIDVFKEFKAAGIDELILDLRYNTGGYVTTSELLASMIVPEAELKAKSVFLQDIYNKLLSKEWGNELTRFSTEFEISGTSGKKRYSTAGANPGIAKLHVIMTDNSASASESTVCGLAPYMPVTITGRQSSGKYCGGLIIDGPTWYGWVKDELGSEEYKTGVKYSNNWGIYVMVSRYADKNGDTPCMPDGYVPDVVVDDDPLDGHELGDPDETMLSTVLNGIAPMKSKSAIQESSSLVRMEEQHFRSPQVLVRN